MATTIDELGRTIDYLRLSVTDKCDCRCLYCMGAEGVPRVAHEDLLPFEGLVGIVRACADLGVTKVRITGGEPLARRGVVDLVSMVAAVPGVREVDMTTNATHLAPCATRLAEVGLTRVNVSLDSLRPERYHAVTRRAHLTDALDGIAAAEAAGLGPIKVNCVLMGGINDDEIPDFVALTRDRPWEVRFIELMPMGPCADWPRERFVPAAEVLAAVPELGRVGEDGVAETYRLPGAAGTVGLIRPMSHRFCEGCSRIRVTADGHLKPCLHSAAEVPLAGLSAGELRDAILEGIRSKPAHHDLTVGHASDAARGMSEIGG